MMRIVRIVAAVLVAAGLASRASGQEPASPMAAAPHSGPVAVSAELEGDEAETRLSIVLSGEVAATSFVIEAPDRVVVELPAVNFQLGPGARVHRKGLVAGLRCGLFGPGRARIVIDLAAPALVRSLQVSAGRVAGTRELGVVLARTDRESFRRAARSPAPETTGAIGRPPPTDLRPVVAIDAGHGGIDPGAIAANGAHEKDIVLAFAQSLRDRLVAGGRLRVVMIRPDDTFVPLDDRVRRGREAGADLFVSIHADSISRPSVRGATVYTGAERASDAESERLAVRENAADAAGGVTAAPAPIGITDILHDLTVRETRNLSHRFAGHLLKDLGETLRFSAQPHREAGFRVLRAHDIPSVLVELGYLSNLRDADLLMSEPWRASTSAAMAKAIDRFFAARLAGRAPVSP